MTRLPEKWSDYIASVRPPEPVGDEASPPSLPTQDAVAHFVEPTRSESQRVQRRVAWRPFAVIASYVVAAGFITYAATRPADALWLEGFIPLLCGGILVACGEWLAQD